jgi:hypothetical protein
MSMGHDVAARGLLSRSDTVGVAEVPVREDALPENQEYRDTGCSLAPSCLDCPLPRCRYDQPGGARRLLTETRDEEIVRRRATERVPVETLARQYALSRRSVFRILRKARAGRRPATPVVAISQPVSRCRRST